MSLRPLVLLTALALAACRDDGVAVRPQLVRVEAPASGASVLAPAAPRAVGASANWSSDVIIERFEVPIRGVALVTSPTGGGANIYQCGAASNDGCLVDVAGTALADLLHAGDASIAPGTYAGLQVYTCGGEGAYTAYLQASVVLGGRTWYTKAAGVLDTVGPSERTPLHYSGCARTYVLADPLVLTAGMASGGAPVTFRMYVDLRDIAWGSLGTTGDGAAWLPSGCSVATPPGMPPAPAMRPFICTGYPDVVASVGEAMPVVERYRVDGAATIGLLFTAAGDQPIGGYTRRYYVEGAPYNPPFSADIPVRDLRKNADGTLYVSTFGGSNGLPTTPGRFEAATFQRATHVGPFNADGAPHGTYSAVRLP